MKTNRVSLITTLAAFACGAIFGAIAFTTPSAAQIQAEAPPPSEAKDLKQSAPVAPLPVGTNGRYQIETYNTNSNYGCYMLDTTTGDLWYTSAGGRLTKIRRQ
jgi:hypothetical protein